jgi:hypothetical protein
MLFLPHSHHLTTFSIRQRWHRIHWQLGQVSVFMLIGTGDIDELDVFLKEYK